MLLLLPPSRVQLSRNEEKTALLMAHAIISYLMRKMVSRAKGDALIRLKFVLVRNKASHLSQNGQASVDFQESRTSSISSPPSWQLWLQEIKEGRCSIRGTEGERERAREGNTKAAVIEERWDGGTDGRTKRDL